MAGVSSTVEASTMFSQILAQNHIHDDKPQTSSNTNKSWMPK